MICQDDPFHLYQPSGRGGFIDGPQYAPHRIAGSMNTGFDPIGGAVAVVAGGGVYVTAGGGITGGGG